MSDNELRLDKVSQIGTNSNLRIQQRMAESFPLHAHNYYEIEIVLEGTGWQWLNGKKYSIQRGCVYLLSPADFHEVQVDGKTRIWNISFDETLIPQKQLEALLTGRYQSIQRLDEEQLKKLDLAAGLLWEEYVCNGSIRPLIEYILSQVIREGEGNARLSAMQKAILYVDTHFREDPSLAQAAAQACLSPVYFGSLFKKYTGETYVNYLNIRKVNCAKMLLESGISVTESCYCAGFGSHSSFLRAFKQNVGMSPGAYRISHRKESV